MQLWLLGTVRSQNCLWHPHLRDFEERNAGNDSMGYRTSEDIQRIEERVLEKEVGVRW